MVGKVGGPLPPKKLSKVSIDGGLMLAHPLKKIVARTWGKWAYRTKKFVPRRKFFGVRFVWLGDS